jgi:hypothetical protein
MWLPCAAEIEGRWRVGKILALAAPDNGNCIIANDQNESVISQGYYVLYAPRDPRATPTP